MSPKFPIFQPQNEDAGLNDPESSSPAMLLILHLRESFNKNSSQSSWALPTPSPAPSIAPPTLRSPSGRDSQQQGKEHEHYGTSAQRRTVQSPKTMSEEFSLTRAKGELILGVEGGRRNHAVTPQS